MCSMRSMSMADRKQKAESLFAVHTEVNAKMEGEYAFITDIMTEKEFDTKVSEMGGVINRIRMEG